MHEWKRPARERGARGRGPQGETTAKKRAWFPAWAADWRPDRFTLLLAAAAALGAGLVFLRQARHGPGIGGDAVNYIMAARNLLAGEGLVGLDGPLVSWPPLYPVLLASGGLFGFDVHAVAGPLNAVLFGLTVLVAGRWLRRHLRSRFLWLWGCLALALALPLAEVASQALSESAFILCVTLALTQIDAHLDGGGRGALLRAAVFSALACLTRYLGVSVLLAVVPLLLAAPGVAPREKMQRIAVYMLIAAAPVGLWMLRNFLVAGSTTGPLGKSFYSFPFIVEEALRIAVEGWWLVGLTAPVLVALVMAAGHAFCRRADRQRGAPAAAEVAWGPLRVCGGFAFAYLTLLVAALLWGGTWSGLQGRFLVPVYVPLLCAALLLMDGVLQYARKWMPRGIVPRRRGVPAIGGGKTVAAILMVVLFLQAAGLVVLHEREMRLWQAGVRQGYATPRWRDSESVQYIREAALTGAILSNALPVMGLYADGPARHYALPCAPDRLRSALSSARGRGEMHVLHFRDWRGECSEQQHDDLGSALARESLLEPVAELADGTLYQVQMKLLHVAIALELVDGTLYRFLRDQAALTGAILSNALPVTGLYADGPARHYALPCAPDRLRSALSSARGRGEVHVLHFRDWRGECSRQQHDDLGNALAREPLLEPVAELADGTLYRFLREQAAMFHSAGAPVVGQSFGAFFDLSRGPRLLSEPWQWEKGSDADGWTSLPKQSPTYVYTPTVADVGHRLRASAYFADPLGNRNRVKATTEPSEPVQPDIPKMVLVPPGSADGRGAAEADRSIRAQYGVYLRGNRLLYENRSCIREDEHGTRFPLIVYSLDAASGTPERDTLDFAWHESSWQNNDGTCVTERQLPDQDLFGIRTGQVDQDGNLLWEGEHWFKEKRQWFYGYWSLVGRLRLANRGTFDIHLGDGSLSFVKEPCIRADTEARFFLHLVPADVNDLPDYHQQYGFDNLDLDFEQHGERFEGRCIMTVLLPGYDVTSIRTGQYVRGVDGSFNNLWEVEFRR